MAAQALPVAAGDRVRAGQALVELDAPDLDAGFRQADAALNEAQSATPEVDNAVNSARAQLELAQVTFRRMQDLFDKKSISNQEFDEASARLKVAQASHAMAEARPAGAVGLEDRPGGSRPARRGGGAWLRADRRPV